MKRYEPDKNPGDKESKTILSNGTTRSQVPGNETQAKLGRLSPRWSVKRLSMSV